MNIGILFSGGDGTITGGGPSLTNHAARLNISVIRIQTIDNDLTLIQKTFG